MVDIIMPVYQRAQAQRREYFKLALKGIRDQTFGGWRLIVVDDCSPTPTKYIIERIMGDKWSKVLYTRNVTNKLLPWTLNRGHALASAKYVMWCCDDDWKEVTFIEKALEAINGYDFINSHEAIYDETGKFKHALDPRKGKPAIPQRILLYPGYLGLAHLYTKKLWERVGGYDEDLFCIEDLDFWFKINRAGAKIGFMDEILHNSLRHPECVTYRDSEITKEARRRFVEKWTSQLSAN